jgi:uncharacterized protein
MSDLFLKETEQGVEIRVKVVPGSSKNQMAGSLDGMLKVKIAAPPEKGKANKALIAFMAKTLSVKKKDVEILSGKINPVKILMISGVNSEIIETLLP